MTKSEQFIRLLALALLGLCLGIGAARAALVDNGNSMIDTDTGLEWLDLTETLGLSWNEVESGLTGGYAHATADQVNTLFLNAGFLTTNNTIDPANDPAADQLLSFLGCTRFCGTETATGRGFSSLGDEFTTRPVYYNSELGSAAVTLSLITSDKDLQDPNAGHFLIRVNAVPLPAAAWLFGSAMVGLVAVGRRKSS